MLTSSPAFIRLNSRTHSSVPTISRVRQGRQAFASATPALPSPVRTKAASASPTCALSCTANVRKPCRSTRARNTSSRSANVSCANRVDSPIPTTVAPESALISIPPLSNLNHSSGQAGKNKTRKTKSQKKKDKDAWMRERGGWVASAASSPSPHTARSATASRRHAARTRRGCPEKVMRAVRGPGSPGGGSRLGVSPGPAGQTTQPHVRYKPSRAIRSPMMHPSSLPPGYTASRITITPRAYPNADNWNRSR